MKILFLRLLWVKCTCIYIFKSSFLWQGPIHEHIPRTPLRVRDIHHLCMRTQHQNTKGIQLCHTKIRVAYWLGVLGILLTSYLRNVPIRLYSYFPMIYWTNPPTHPCLFFFLLRFAVVFSPFCTSVGSKMKRGQDIQLSICSYVAEKPCGCLYKLTCSNAKFHSLFKCKLYLWINFIYHSKVLE